MSYKERFLVFQVIGTPKVREPLDFLRHRQEEYEEILIGAYSGLMDAKRDLQIPTETLSDNLNGGEPFVFKGKTYDCRWESAWIKYLETKGKPVD